MSGIDLHIHTNASDGRYSPEDIVRKAVALKLEIIAICDHDTVDGIGRALAEARHFPGLRVIPGVEISTDVPHGEMHMLGYFIDCTDRELLETLDRMRHSRERRAQRMIEKLARLGINIDWLRIQEIAGDAPIGRPHIAQAMLEKGYITSTREAFARYIGREGPAYAEREKLEPVETVNRILRAGGLPVLAHPMTLPEPEAMIIQLKAAGLVGIESYYGGSFPSEVNSLVAIADKYQLIPTGGSDYHGIDETTETAMGGSSVPRESAERLIELAQKRRLKMA